MESNNDNPIKISGAGISGLSAAVTLARNGLKVEVFEKGPYAGGRFTRDFQCLRDFGNATIDPIKEFEKLGIYIKPYKKLMRIVRYSQSHSFELISKNKPIYYVVLRGENEKSVDSQLEKSAIDQGATINYNTKLNISETDIVATGPSRVNFVAYGEIYEDTNFDDAGYVFLDRNYSPNGYLYVLPGEKKGEAEIINSSVDPIVSMQTIKLLYNRAIQENNILKDFLNGANRKSIQGGIACSTLLDTPYQNNRYYIGEAAGLQDVAAGFGIRYAVISGYLAAQSILTGEYYNEYISKTFKSQLEFERERSGNLKKLTNEKIDKIFQLINEKFGHELTIDEYESMRGVI